MNFLTRVAVVISFPLVYLAHWLFGTMVDLSLLFVLVWFVLICPNDLSSYYTSIGVYEIKTKQI